MPAQQEGDHLILKLPLNDEFDKSKKEIEKMFSEGWFLIHMAASDNKCVMVLYREKEETKQIPAKKSPIKLLS